MKSSSFALAIVCCALCGGALTATQEPPSAADQHDRAALQASSIAPPSQHDSAALQAARYRGAMLPSWGVKEEDLRTLASWGANLARYQMAVGWGKKNANRDLAEFDKWVDGKLDVLDDVLDWAGKYGLRIVVDLHVPPGGRGEGGEMNMFHEREYADHFISTWRRIARRFRGDRRIYGYDLINEPTNNKPSPDGLDYWSVQFAAAKAVREEDPETPIIFESNMWCQAPTYAQMKPVPLDGVIYQLHMYAPVAYTHQGTNHGQAAPANSLRWPDTECGFGRDWLRGILQPVREFCEKNPGTRIYVGEFSASVWAPGAENYLRDCIALFEEYGWDWTYHAFRESKSWNVEMTVEDGKIVPAREVTPRKRALLEGLRGAVR